MTLKAREPRAVVASNCWRGYFGAAVVSDHVAARFLAAVPDVTVDVVPVADGGDGTLDVIADHLDLEIHTRTVRSPSGREVVARYGWHPATRTGVVEMAEASGLHVDDEPVGILDRSSHGAGELVAAVLDRGADRLIYGAGGSATADAGAGLAQALGVGLLDGEGRRLDGTPRSLLSLAAVDRTDLHRGVGRATATVLADTAVTIADSVRTFGPQKGMADDERQPAEEATRRATDLLQGPVARTEPWRAAGGASAGTVASLFGTRPVSGARWIADLVGLPERIGPGVVAVTAEGRFDRSSLLGKATGVVISLCDAAGASSVVLCATADPDAVAAVPPSCRVIPVSSSGEPVGLEEIADAALDGLDAATHEPRPARRTTPRVPHDLRRDT